MSAALIFYGPTPSGLIGAPFHAYVERDGRTLGRTSGIATLEEARVRAERYRTWYGPESQVIRETQPEDYAAFRVTFTNEQGYGNAVYELSDVSIGCVAVRAQQVRTDGDVIAISYVGGAS